MNVLMTEEKNSKNLEKSTKENDSLKETTQSTSNLSKEISKDTIISELVGFQQIRYSLFPPPEEFKQYPKEVQDHYLERSNTQLHFRMEMERKSVETETNNSTLGVIFGFIIGLLGNPWASSILGIGSLTGLVSVFIYGTRQRNEK